MEGSEEQNTLALSTGGLGTENTIYRYPSPDEAIAKVIVRDAGITHGGLGVFPGYYDVTVGFISL